MAKALGLDTQSQEELLKVERRANNAWSKLKRNKTTPTLHFLKRGIC